jgi:hypothetical protein
MGASLTPEMQAILDAAQKGIREAEQNLARYRAIEAMVLGTPAKPATPPVPNGQPMTIGQACERVLLNAGKAMTTAEVAQGIIDAGLYRPDGDFRAFSNNVFSTMRRKTDIFVKLGVGTWGLVARGDAPQ